MRCGGADILECQLGAINGAIRNPHDIGRGVEHDQVFVIVSLFYLLIVLQFVGQLVIDFLFYLLIAAQFAGQLVFDFLFHLLIAAQFAGQLVFDFLFYLLIVLLHEEREVKLSILFIKLLLL